MFTLVRMVSGMAAVCLLSGTIDAAAFRPDPAVLSIASTQALWTSEALNVAALEALRPLLDGRARSRVIRSSPGPGAAGHSLSIALSKMLLEWQTEETSLGALLHKQLVARYHALTTLADTPAYRTLQALVNAKDAVAHAERVFQQWLEHAPALDFGVGLWMSRAVREQLRDASRLPRDRRRAIVKEVQEWATANALVSRHAFPDVDQVILELPLAHGPLVHLEVEAMDHARSTLAGVYDVAGLNMRIDHTPNDTRFAILLEDRGYHTVKALNSTLRHEVWEAGLRALGYRAGEAHTRTVQAIEKNQPLHALLNMPSYQTPTRSTGPSASVTSLYRQSA